MSENKYMTFDIPEWVNWLARDSDGKLFGYKGEPSKGGLGWLIPTEDIVQAEEYVYCISTSPLYKSHISWGDNRATYIPRLKKHIDLVELTPEPDIIQNDTPDMVNTPPHYKQYSFEPIDIITEVVKEYPPEIGFHIGTTLKYLFRSPFKGKQEEDLQKAEYYLTRANKELTDE